LYIYGAFYEKLDVVGAEKLAQVLTTYGEDFELLVLNYHVNSSAVTTFENVATKENYRIVNCFMVGDINGVYFINRNDAEAVAKFLFDTYTFSVPVNKGSHNDDEKLLATDICLT
jgi:hypothetical protein